MIEQTDKMLLQNSQLPLTHFSQLSQTRIDDEEFRSFSVRPLLPTAISPIVQLYSLPSSTNALPQELTHSTDGHPTSTHQEAEYHSTLSITEDQYHL